MKEYKFELTIFEGNDEFWEELEDRSGCDEVQALVEEALGTMGLCKDDNIEIRLKEFKQRDEKISWGG
jgi:hypothetical protein